MSKFGKSLTALTGILALVNTAPNVSAQEINAEETDTRPLRTGAKALQFSTTFYGVSGAYKFHSSPNRAWRLGGQFALNINDQSAGPDGFSDIFDDVTNPIIVITGVPSRYQQSEIDAITITAEAVKMFYSSITRETSFYWGLGPSVTANYSKRRSVRGDVTFRSYDSTTTYYQSESMNKSTSYGAGVALIVGGEWFARSSLSLYGELRSSMAYTWGHRTNVARSQRVTIDNTGSVLFLDYDSETRPDRHSAFRVSGYGASLGISIYFGG